MILGFLSVLCEVQFESRSGKLLCSSPSEACCLSGVEMMSPHRD